MVSQVHACVKTYQILHSKDVYFITCELNCNTALKEKVQSWNGNSSSSPLRELCMAWRLGCLVKLPLPLLRRLHSPLDPFLCLLALVLSLFHFPVCVWGGGIKLRKRRWQSMVMKESGYLRGYGVSFIQCLWSPLSELCAQCPAQSVAVRGSGSLTKSKGAHVMEVSLAAPWGGTAVEGVSQTHFLLRGTSEITSPCAHGPPDTQAALLHNRVLKGVQQTLAALHRGGSSRGRVLLSSAAGGDQRAHWPHCWAISKPPMVLWHNAQQRQKTLPYSACGQLLDCRKG